MKNFRSLLTAITGSLLLAGLVNTAQAATCIATSTFTDPDATLTNSGPCGEGIVNDANDSAADVSTATGETWTLVGAVGAPLYLTFTGTTGGSWFIDASAPDDTDFLIVIKDGAAPGGSGDNIQWVWFDVDTSIPCADTSFDYCGTWTMYGSVNAKTGKAEIKNISHMSLYSQEGADVLPVPEPGTLALLGVAILGLTIARRKFHA